MSDKSKSEFGHFTFPTSRHPIPSTQVSTYCGDELLHAVGRHTVEVCEVELQVDLVVEHVLAQWAA